MKTDVEFFDYLESHTSSYKISSLNFPWYSWVKRQQLASPKPFMSNSLSSSTQTILREDLDKKLELLTTNVDCVLLTTSLSPAGINQQSLARMLISYFEKTNQSYLIFEFPVSDDKAALVYLDSPRAKRTIPFGTVVSVLSSLNEEAINLTQAEYHSTLTQMFQSQGGFPEEFELPAGRLEQTMRDLGSILIPEILILRALLEQLKIKRVFGTDGLSFLADPHEGYAIAELYPPEQSSDLSSIGSCSRTFSPAIDAYNTLTFSAKNSFSVSHSAEQLAKSWYPLPCFEHRFFQPSSLGKDVAEGTEADHLFCRYFLARLDQSCSRVPSGKSPAYLDSASNHLVASLQCRESKQLLGIHYPLYFGQILSNIPATPEVKRELENIPGELSPQERFFYYHFFANIWEGKGDVIEIGPFLGSSTKAIAMGMSKNPSCTEKHKLLTYDRFGRYHDRSTMLMTLAPLFADGTLSQEIYQTIAEGEEFPDFYDIFELIHRDTPYGYLIEPCRGTLPILREENGRIPNQLCVSRDRHFDVVFIDGCKSWYSIKYFVGEVINNLDKGAYFILQDYGWYTCFWLPCFVALFEEFFELVAHVQYSYVFRLRAKCNRTIIEQFPDTAAGFSAEAYNQIFTHLVRTAGERGDLHQIVYGTMQHAAALASIGEMDRARQIMRKLAEYPFSAKYSQRIASASACPAYTTAGEPIHLGV